MLKWLIKKCFGDRYDPIPEEQPKPRLPERLNTQDAYNWPDEPQYSVKDYLDRFIAAAPTPPAPERGELRDGQAMDSTDLAGNGETASFKENLSRNQGAISDALAMWFASQTFIGHPLAAMIAQQWLVNKACLMPARDAIRKGFTVISADGNELPPQVSKLIDRADRRYNLRKNMLEFIHKGRIFGIRIAIFKIDGIDYSAPFNIDGVKAGSYRGIVQVDPYWCAPQLDRAASAEPDDMHFYEPTYWNINGVKYHRSHLIIFRNGDLPDILKPVYLYGGIPVPQLIMERVYGAERTANEAPLLAMTKRTTIYKTDLTKAIGNLAALFDKLRKWSKFWSNNGIRVIETDDEVVQTDTSLADLDAVIMTQYQLVAAASEVPATKILGTSPKGFGASGEYEESSYHEFLESIQEHDLSPLVERHHEIVMRSFVTPVYPDAANIQTMVNWEPLDSMTAKERAEVELIQSQTGVQLATSGAIDGIDERNRLIADKDSPYVNLPPVERGVDDGAE